MGSFTMEMPDQKDMAGGGNYLKVPGSYHLKVLKVDEQPTDKDNRAISGFKVDFEVLGGSEAGKKIDVLFFNPTKAPEPGKKDWPRLKQAAFLLATGLVDPSAFGKQVSIDLQQAEHRQVIAEFQFDERDAEKAANQKFLQLHFANIYHVDDPQVASVAKDAASLKLLPSNLRRDPASFKSTGGNANGSASAPQSQPAADDDLGDL